MSDTLADRLAAFALTTRFEDLPGEGRGRGPPPAGRCPRVRHRGTRGARFFDRAAGRRANSRLSVGPTDRRRHGRARLGRIRQWRSYPLSRLQRHLPLARAGTPQRQLGGRDGRRRARRRRRQGLDRRRGDRLRGPMPAVRRRQHPGPGLGPHHLRLALVDPGRGASCSGSRTSRPSTRSASPARPGRHCGSPAPASSRCGKDARSPSPPATACSRPCSPPTA